MNFGTLMRLTTRLDTPSQVTNQCSVVTLPLNNDIHVN